MNCFEFRRLKLADPRRLSPQAADHAGQCGHCRAFAAEVDDNEARLAGVLLVPVPEGLTERITLQRKNRSKLPYRLSALAAGVMLTLAVGVGFWIDFLNGEHAREAIRHVMDEPESLTTTRLADQEVFRRVMHTFGAQGGDTIGRVRFIKVCPVPEGTGWHIVLDTEHGLATLILVPTSKARVRQAEAAMAGWKARAEPGGKGYYAIITRSDESLEAVSRMFKQRVRWRS